MQVAARHPELESLLARFDAAGGVLDYVFLEPQEGGSPYACHRAAVLAGMAEVDRRLEHRADRDAAAHVPPDTVPRVRWDEARLTGEPVSFARFWGTDDVEVRPTGNRAGIIPDVDGYKTAFFLPPYGLHGSPSELAELFARINQYLLGAEPQRAEIFSWSTDWANYFESGHEWWGAFCWTVRPADSRRLTVVLASATD
jgi:hypothetical protein